LTEAFPIAHTEFFLMYFAKISLFDFVNFF